jgi:class 3 adenylate cyclase
LRTFGRGGQILVSATTASADGLELPEGSSLVDAGTATLRRPGPAERVWRLVHPDLPLSPRPSVTNVSKATEAALRTHVDA